MNQRNRGAAVRGSSPVLGPSSAPWRRRMLAGVLAVTLAAGGAIAVQATAPAYAADYPSWQDVEAARSDEQVKQGEIDKIRDILAGLQSQATAAQTVAEERGGEYQTAVQAFDNASYKVDQLQAQADAAQAVADESKLRAGQLAARLARAGGGDVSASLFFGGDSAEDLLQSLGMASKITDQSAGVYAKAVQDQNAAQLYTDQAEVAKKALKDLADAAEAALKVANDAADAAAAALAEQQDNQAVLEAQLAVLSENRAATEADYNAGERAAAAAAAALLKLQQDATARSTATSASIGATPAGQVGGSGWSLPAAGRIASPYGYRVNPATGAYALHAGVDIGAGCGTAIYAAHSGTVTQSGPNGGYGNFIQIANGDGTSTAYGHIVNGGLLVGRNAQVQAGQLIALVGSTGQSTGCHLHFEVRLNGTATNPVTYLADRGVKIG